MNIFVLDIAILLGLIFVGVLLFGVARQHNNYKFQFLPTPEMTWAFSVSWFVGTALFFSWFVSNYPELTLGVSSGEAGGSFALGFLGLILTALTGMALTTAWRAVDDAESAKIISQSILDELATKEKFVSVELLRHAAFLDAVNMLSIGKMNENFLTSPRYKLAQLFCAAFSCTSAKATSQALTMVALQPTIAEASSVFSTPRIKQYIRLLSENSEIDLKHRLKLSQYL